MFLILAQHQQLLFDGYFADGHLRSLVAATVRSFECSLSLQELARNAVRQTIGGRHFARRVALLPLPAALRRLTLSTNTTDTDAATFQKASKGVKKIWNGMKFETVAMRPTAAEWFRSRHDC